MSEGVQKSLRELKTRPPGKRKKVRTVIMTREYGKAVCSKTPRKPPDLALGSIPTSRREGGELVGKPIPKAH